MRVYPLCGKGDSGAAAASGPAHATITDEASLLCIAAKTRALVQSRPSLNL